MYELFWVLTFVPIGQPAVASILDIKRKLKMIFFTSALKLTLTLCKSTVFMIEPWKKVTVVKCLLNRPSSSNPGGVLASRKKHAWNLMKGYSFVRLLQNWWQTKPKSELMNNWKRFFWGKQIYVLAQFINPFPNPIFKSNFHFHSYYSDLIQLSEWVLHCIKLLYIYLQLMIQFKIHKSKLTI